MFTNILMTYIHILVILEVLGKKIKWCLYLLKLKIDYTWRNEKSPVPKQRAWGKSREQAASENIKPWEKSRNELLGKERVMWHQPYKCINEPCVVVEQLFSSQPKRLLHLSPAFCVLSLFVLLLTTLLSPHSRKFEHFAGCGTIWKRKQRWWWRQNDTKFWGTGSTWQVIACDLQVIVVIQELNKCYIR